MQTRFLRYIRQWGKKVVFVVNKADILRSEEEVAEVRAFVAESARNMLGVDATVLPVSARLALEAKVAAGSAEHGGVLGAGDAAARLQPDGRWRDSRFLGLETYMLNFLTGGGAGGEGGASGSESKRLKLETPLFVAEALLQAAAQQLDVELGACKREVRALRPS